MKSTKIFALILALLLIGSLFAACGGEGEEQTQPAATLPTAVAPNGTESLNPEMTGEGQTASTEPAQNPAEPTKDGTSDEQSGTEPEGGDATKPAPEQTNPTQPAPGESAPAPSAVPVDDSEEDLPETTGPAADDTDEDIP